MVKDELELCRGSAFCGVMVYYCTSVMPHVVEALALGAERIGIEALVDLCELIDSLVDVHRGRQGVM